MKRRLRIILSLTLVVLLAVSSVAYAKPGQKGYQKNAGKKQQQIERLQEKFSSKFDNHPGNGHGWRRRVIDNYVKINRNRLKVNGAYVDFLDPDTSPVIRAGRTLLPLRAIVDSLGGYIFWDPERSIAAVINSQGTIMIWFDLEDKDDGTGIYIFDVEEGITFDFEDEDNPYDPLAIDYEDVLDDWDLRSMDYGLDVLPGLINNRTFAPLRFIAETFGLMVYYDDDTGQIDIMEDPKLYPKMVKYEEDSEDDIDVGIVLNGYTLEGIYESYDGELILDKQLSASEYTTRAAIVINTTDPGLIVTLDGGYVDDMDDGVDTIMLYFRFIKDAVGDIVKTFKIRIED